MKQNNRQLINLEQLTEEMIRFLQNWGLWEDASILTLGKRYAYAKEGAEEYRGLKHVMVTEGVDPEEVMQGITGEKDGQGKLVWKSLANPEHVFDMVFEGPLSVLLSFELYEPVKADIGEEAWKIIFEKTNQEILGDFLYEKYGCTNAEEYLEVLEEEAMDYSSWDPLEFDTWEEYQEFIGYEEDGLPENVKRFDTYKEYQEYMEAGGPMSASSVEPVWERMLEEAKREFIKDCGRDGEARIAVPELTGFIRNGFRELLEKYGLYFELCFSWSLSCFRMGE